MAQKTATSATAVADTPARSQVSALADRRGQGDLVIDSDRGKTTIQPHVVAKIAGLAVREVPGVHSLVPWNAGQTLSNLARSLGGAEMRNLGVNVEVGQIEAAVDVRLVAMYGASIPGVAAAIRDNVTERIHVMTGLVVKEINIEVVDLHFEDDEAPKVEASERRVQ